MIALLCHAVRSWSGAAEISPEGRVWCSRAHSPLFFPRGKTLLTQPADELRKLSIDGVYDWAVKTAGLEEEDAAILKKQKIDGKSLFKLTEDKLLAYGMPGGPAIELMDALDAVRPVMSLPELGPIYSSYGAFMFCPNLACSLRPPLFFSFIIVIYGERHTDS